MLMPNALNINVACRLIASFGKELLSELMMQKFPDKAGKRIIYFQSVCPDFSEETEGCPIGQKLALLPLNFRC